ncbi:hypothetical protein [Dactylosporangium sp. NPDC051541]|uniref:hypothetical protein n=1 Tax=Dactylosporangium sp. NPDC051541 TaxID=3363977 RepID=UPI00379680F1
MIGASDDDALGTAVARVYTAVDPPPVPLLQAASELLAWRSPDAALAALLLDSAVSGEAAGVRAGPGGGSRMLSYGAGDTVLDLELTAEDGVLHVTGQVSRPVAAPLRIRHRDGTWSGTTDAVGRFTVADLPAGPLRVTWGPGPDGATITTPAILPP